LRWKTYNHLESGADSVEERPSGPRSGIVEIWTLALVQKERRTAPSGKTAFDILTIFACIFFVIFCAINDFCA
jgi:hypothetical protein